MHRKMWVGLIAVLTFVGFVQVRQGLCYRVPTEESGIRYLYVFGEDGKKSYGAKREPQVIFLRIPDTGTGKIKISIYDPDVGGAIDEKSGKWNTRTKFSILGGQKAYSSIAGRTEAKIMDFYQGTLIEEKTFGEEERYDKNFYHFSPIDANLGEKIGDFRYFKIVAKGLSGDDNNVFAVEVSPDSIEAFGYALALRLAERRGTKMALYPEVPRDATKIVEYNYDLDPTGGDIELISASRGYKIKSSGTGMWANTKIDFPSGDAGRRWVYEITKGTQPNANMAMYLTDADGRAIPVFFTPGIEGPKRVFVERPRDKEEPWMDSKLSCNTFTFDGSKSYDPDRQELSYFWDFGDGTTSSQIRSMHTYKDAGKYLVKLTVTDASEAECNTATTQQVIKVNQPPCAIADGPNISCVNGDMLFDGTQSTDTPEDVLTYRWDFGDGQTQEGAKVSHNYAKGGEYLVMLTVTDDSGTICDTGMDKLKVSVNTPPAADAGRDILVCKNDPSDPLEVTFDGAKSSDADGDELSYVWDFGDGQSAEGKVVSHRYEKGGEYIARLLIRDNTDTLCNKSSATRVVTLNRAPMARAGKNLNICLTEKAELDAGESFDNDGDVLNYEWDLGDGKTAKGKKVSHKFAKGGIYQITLKVDDNTGTDCAASIDKILADVNSTPTAEISAKDIACVEQDVQFDGTLSGDPDGDRLSYTWDFGDGTTGSGSNARHSYAKGGMYKAMLYVDDGRDSECSGATKVHYINVNTPPLAKAGPSLILCVNDVIDFDGTESFDPDNDNLTYTWDFGDGQTEVGPRVSHAYKDIGVYKVVLAVTDDSGTACNTSVDTLVATVNAEPVPIIEVI